MKDYKHLTVKVQDTERTDRLTLKEVLLCIALMSLLTIDWATLLL